MRLDHKEAVYSAAFSPDSKQVVTASEDGTAKIWVVEDWALQADAERP